MIHILQLFDNLLLFPFKLLWNIIVTGLIIGGFILWFGFIFGSVIAVILIIIFAPELFLLPLVLAGMYTEIWPEIYYEHKPELIEDKEIKDNSDHGALIAFGFVGGLFLIIFIGSWAWHFITS